MREPPLKAIAVGVSTGGLAALKDLLQALPASFPVPILIVQHLCPDAEDTMAAMLDGWCALRVKEADLDERPLEGTAYLAPANYHLQVEPDGRLSLSIDPPVHCARPSVDVLFETAAAAHGAALAGVVLTGAGCDGSLGLKRIQQRGGIAIVQDPGDAACAAMPASALQHVRPDHLVTLNQLPELLLRLTRPHPLSSREHHAE